MPGFRSIYDFKRSAGGLNSDSETEPDFRTGLAYFLHALSSIEKHVADLDRNATGRFQVALQALRTQLAANPELGAAEASRTALDEILKAHSDEITASYKQRDADIREIIGVLGAAADGFSANNDQHRSHLKLFAEQLQGLSRLDDLGNIRRELSKQASELRSTMETMWKESSASISQLQAQVSQFQERLENAEKLASTDELTGLLNRRAGEARLVEKIQAARRFCLIILDLDRFKAINDSMGHSAGDQVLRVFSKRLSNFVQASDVVCRWGGDEFAVLMDCELHAGLRRAAQIRSELATQVTTVLIGKEFQIPVSASVGVAEYTAGDDVESLFARADAALYQQKKPGPRSRTA